MEKTKKVRKFPIWIMGLMAGILCLVIGAYNGQLLDIYRKAIMICLECIGIG